MLAVRKIDRFLKAFEKLKETEYEEKHEVTENH